MGVTSPAFPRTSSRSSSRWTPPHFDRRKWLAISYVRALVDARFGKVDGDLQKEWKKTTPGAKSAEIALVAKVMDISNRGANTWDSMLARLQGRPAAQAGSSTKPC